MTTVREVIDIKRLLVGRIRRAANELASQEDPPTTEDIEAYFALVRQLPVPDFEEWYANEKSGNTERYQAVVEERKRLLREAGRRQKRRRRHSFLCGEGV